jgi:hypothetical protein
MKIQFYKFDFTKILLTLFIVTTALVIPTESAFAFTKLKNGFETITNTYLVPLSNAAAGASLIFYLLMAYFRQEEYQKKAAAVFGLAICTAVGLEVLKTIEQSFS